MKSKKLLIALTTMMFAALIVVAVALSYSWYSVRQTSDLEIDIPANGFFVIVFEEEPDYGDIALKPAVAMPNAVRDNLYMDVLTVFNESDVNPSYISEAATVANYNTILKYYNEDTTLLPNCDLIFDANARVLLPDGTETPLELEKELVIKCSADIEYRDGKPAENVEVNLKVPFTIQSNAVITFNMEVYIALPDELCDPAVNEGVLRIILSVASNTAPAVVTE